MTLACSRVGRFEAQSNGEIHYDSNLGKLGELRRPTLFETSHAPLQMKLFNLVEALGEDGWLKALKVGEYALRQPRRTQASQRRLFALTKAL